MSHYLPLPLTALVIGLSANVYADHLTLPAISIEGETTEATPYAIPVLPMVSADTGSLVRNLPGVEVNRNGAITSIAQYRGLFGSRVNVLIDGVAQQEAGPNSMDSPLSYIAASRTKSVSVYRGIAPVSSGIETMGGTISVQSNYLDFGQGDHAEVRGLASAGYASNGNSRQYSLTTAVTNQHHRLQISGSSDRGDDMKFDKGTIRSTKHDRDTIGLHYGYQQQGARITADIEHLDIGATGTPTLPMDIVFFRGENYKFLFDSDLGDDSNYQLRLRYQNVKHEMDNFRQRTKPMMAQRFVRPDVKAFGFSGQYQQNNITMGFDIDHAEHNTTIFSPNNPSLFIEAFNHINRDRYSLFAEWQGQSQEWEIETGIRYTRVESDADDVDFDGIPMMARPGLTNLKDRLNSADKNQADNLVDLVAVFKRELTPELNVELGLARKTRAPSYQERYLWAPIEVTAGLADGNSYIGDVDLDHEVAYQFEFGLDWRQDSIAVTPRLFYHHINDYIQGVSADSSDTPLIRISSLAPFGGDSTPLQYSNVDAKLYGLDINWLAAITNSWQLSGTVAYVRGKRRDTSDNLYRIAPLNARTTLSYNQPLWSVALEAETVAKQNHISVQNDEQKTAGYALYHLAAQYQLTPDLELSAGINNLFDRGYANHLAGYNRAQGNRTDVNLGERIPGVGRNGYINATLSF